MDAKNSESKDLIAYQQAQLEETYEKLDDRLREIDRLVATNTAVIGTLKGGDHHDIITALRELEASRDDLEGPHGRPPEQFQDREQSQIGDGGVGLPTKTRPRAPKARGKKKGLPKPSAARYRRARRQQQQILDL